MMAFDMTLTFALHTAELVFLCYGNTCIRKIPLEKVIGDL